jgi:hypothetical protein
VGLADDLDAVDAFECSADAREHQPMIIRNQNLHAAIPPSGSGLPNPEFGG